MSAVISECGQYRYLLGRSLGGGGRGPVVLFVGVNPSTANADLDDATVRKWRGFARAWGFDRFEAVNLFAYRTTDVRMLARVPDPIGPRNEAHVRQAIDRAHLVVPCWGAAAKLPDRLRGGLQWGKWMAGNARDSQCLGLTKCGQPRHPLMLGYATPLQPWPEEGK